MAEVDGSVGNAADSRHPSTGPLDVVVVPSDDRAVVLRVVGEVDVLTAPILATHIDRHFGQRTEDDRRRLVIDLRGVTFLASAGLAVLARAANLATQYHAEVRLVVDTRVVLRPLTLTGLDKALSIVGDVAAAIGEG